jgi:cysteine synthase
MAQVIQNNEGEWVLRDEWDIDDVRNIIDVEGFDDVESFTDNDCLNVLRIVANQHDCNFGITWGIISNAIEYYAEKMRKGKSIMVKGVTLSFSDECIQSKP